MFNERKTFDLVVSLGGNCAAAHQLQYKNLRTESYPFDWTYFTSDEAVYQLAKGFKTNFNNYALKKNFEELPPNPEHPDRIQYKDKYAKIVWANHFDYGKNDNYKEVKQKLDRRFKRLIDSINKSKNILFIFSVSFKIAPNAFLNLIETLKTLYPHKQFNIKVLSFDAGADRTFTDNNVEIYYYKRSMNTKDFSSTNKEWNFIDNINKYERFVNRIRKKIVRRIICLIPKKSLRHKLKQKYHV